METVPVMVLHHLRGSLTWMVSARPQTTGRWRPPFRALQQYPLTTVHVEPHDDKAVKLGPGLKHTVAPSLHFLQRPSASRVASPGIAQVLATRVPIPESNKERRAVLKHDVFHSQIQPSVRVQLQYRCIDNKMKSSHA